MPGGIGDGDFGSGEDVVGGPDDFAVGHAGKFGAETEFERRICRIGCDIDEEDGVGAVRVVDVKQLVDEDDWELVDGADLARTSDLGQLITRERDDFEAACAGELALADRIELEQGFFGEHGAAGDGEDDDATNAVGDLGDSLDVSGRVEGASDRAFALWEYGAAGESEGK